MLRRTLGRRVVIRWRGAAGEGEEIADVVGVLEAVGVVSFVVRKDFGDLVTIPRSRALADKTVQPAPRRRHREPESGSAQPAPGRPG